MFGIAAEVYAFGKKKLLNASKNDTELSILSFFQAFQFRPAIFLITLRRKNPPYAPTTPGKKTRKAS
jgi:hypothetical protein